jgi:hypothetical protein
MGKMSWIHYLATNDKEEELLNLLVESGWKKGAAKIGVKEFVKAANQIETDKQNKKKKKSE